MRTEIPNGTTNVAQGLYTNSISDAWDGKFNGMELNTAVFVYSIKVKYKDGREVIQQGNITLVK